MIRILTCGAVLIAASLSAGAQAPPVIKYTPTGGVPTYAVREPVLRIAPGTTVETRTYSIPGDYYEGGAWPGEVGPFHIEGAAAGQEHQRLTEVFNSFRLIGEPQSGNNPPKPPAAKEPQ